MKKSHILLLMFAFGCAKLPTDPFTFAFSKNKMLKEVANDPQYKVQIIFTDIMRKDRQVTLKDYTYKLDDHRYYYPASTVKLPAAILSLEKLKYLRGQGIQINRNTPFEIDNDTSPSTVASNIAEIFAVSDNSAYNRLYEFLGRDYMNQKMKSKGLEFFRISHRLSIPDSANDTLETVVFHLSNGEAYVQASTVNNPVEPLTLGNLKKGIGYYKGDSLIGQPFDFSLKNQYSLSTTHETLKRLIFAEKYPENQRFDLAQDDRKFLIETMALLPRECRYRQYDSDEYYDSYVKFLIFGDSKKPIPEYMKIYNKVGDAYGYLTDVSYVVDSKNKIEFMLSATIYVNKNKIFNDDTYEYETIGIPFLAELGRQLYAYKLKSVK